MLAQSSSTRRRRFRREAFTVLELMTVMVIILVLAVILFQAYGAILPRLDRARCTANLRNLHVAAGLYLQDHRTWPQIKVSGQTDEAYASAWITTLKPYNIDQKAWVCPTTQSRMGSPNLADPENVRIDYKPTPFSTGERKPFQWTNQPWFAETFNEHGSGNLIVFPDGHVESMFEVVKRMKPGAPVP